MTKTMISLKDVMVYDDYYKDTLPINFVLNKGENVTLLGDNGSEKSFLPDILRGLKRTRSGESFYGYDLNSPSLYKFISHTTFRSEYGGTDFFFQQRWNSTESDNVPVVNDQLCQIERDDTERARLYAVLNTNNLLS